MPKLLIECKNCGKIFPSGIFMAPGSSATFIGNKSQCPFCGSMENIPDGTFRATVEGFVEILEQSKNPLDKAKELLEALEKIKGSSDLAEIKKSSKFSEFKKWLPDSPEKIATYIAIIYTIIQLLTQKPDVHIEYNDFFISQYNQVINIEKNLSPSSAEPSNPPKAD